MKIVPNRNMFLDNRRVEAGKIETVSKEAGDLALSHRWATLAVEGSKNPAKKGKKEDKNQTQDDQGGDDENQAQDDQGGDAGEKTD